MTAQPTGHSICEQALEELVRAPRAAVPLCTPPSDSVVIDLAPRVAGVSEAGSRDAAMSDVGPQSADPQSGGADASEPLTRLARAAARRSSIEAELLSAARDLAAEVGEVLLSEKGYTSIDELSAGLRRRWRAEVKKLTCAEIQVRLGVGITEARQLVGVACAPLPVREPVETALSTGLVTWGHVRGFWERCGRLPADEAALVAEGLFGDDPDAVVAERLAPDGTLLDRPWHHAEYWAALERETTRVEGQDVEAERERRRRARQERHVGLRIDDDSTATLTIVGPLVTLSAVAQRLDGAARSLRKSGDERTLAQLRTDVAETLLLHGTVDLRGSSGADGGRSGPAGQVADPLVTPDDPERIAQVVAAQPSVHLQVVVPWDALALRSSAATPAQSDPRPEPSTRPDSTSPAHRRPAPDSPSRGAVGEILGRYPAFITPGHARELSLAPGTTLSRLLVDPADGRLIERSIASYRPDAAMRRQVVAADVHSRAPGSRAPAQVCELDHEIPWGSPGSTTSETNLDLKDVSAHQRKTARWWSSALAPNRDVRWETLLGQVETTRCHDYRQYLDRRHPPSSDPGDRLDLACQALYAALAHRGPGALLTDPDDLDGATDHDVRLTGWISMTHRGPDGLPRRGAPQDRTGLAALLGYAAPEQAEDRPTVETTEEARSATSDEVAPSPQESSETPPWSRPADDPPPF